MATIKIAVKIDRKTCFIRGARGPGQMGKHSAIAGKAAGQRVLSAVTLTGGRTSRGKRKLNYRRPDQSSATRIESLGFDGSYFTLACCPAISRSNCTWLSRPVMSCAV